MREGAETEQRPAVQICDTGRTAAFWKKFKLDAEAVAWSGDNPCAVVGLGLLEVGDIAISLGTSDTCLAVIPGVPAEPLPFADAHIAGVEVLIAIFTRDCSLSLSLSLAQHAC